MLPGPVFNKRRRGGISERIGGLSQRSRITNLGVLLLGGVCCISLLGNLSGWIGGGGGGVRSEVALGGGTEAESILWTIPRGRVRARNLVVVAGHAIWKGCLPERRMDDGDWVLEEYQRGTRSIAAFFSHIVRGAEAVLGDEESLLVFSGGHTRATSTISEGESYARLAIESNLFQNGFLPFGRATSEDYSLDSLENMLFSIARFHEVTGEYPWHITVIGFEMKRRRFEELHLKALRWPVERFTYIGVDEEGDTSAQYARENENGYIPFSRDLYGCHGALLEKRRERNRSARFHPYHSSAPDLVPLLNWCPDTNSVFPGSLPWD